MLICLPWLKLISECGFPSFKQMSESQLGFKTSRFALAEAVADIVGRCALSVQELIAPRDDRFCVYL
jgi:hypothetical protein